ncbi:MAG: hypothetical protein WCO03_02110 [bacterium]
MKQLEGFLEEYFGRKAPALPAGGKEFIVKVSPYLAIISLILMVPALLGLLAVLGIGAVAMPFAVVAGAQMGILFLISAAIIVISIILTIIAIPGLFKRQIKGWQMMYYSTLLSLLSSLISLNLIGFIVSAIISFYILFQVKSLYH